jgi:hypothetical protein
MNGWRCVSTVLGTACLLSWPHVGDAQSQSISELQSAKTCSSTSSLASVGAGNGQVGETKMTVGNDGGWCWFSLTATKGSLIYAPTYRVTRAPSHGELMMGEVDHRMRIAYKPVPGFAGEDTFDIANPVTNSERTVTVTVAQ